MKIGKLVAFSALWACMAFAFVGCDDDDPKEEPAGGVPTETVSNLAFADTDADSLKIAGPLTWTAPASVANITKYVVYLSSDGKAKDTKLGESTVGTDSFTVPEGTAYQPFLVVVTANAQGESASLAEIAVVDNGANNQPEPEPEPEPAAYGVYILNSGKMSANNATLDFYDRSARTLQTKLFSTANGRGLGDTANDLLIYGGKMYIAVSNSNTIEITDLNGKSLQTIAPTDESGQPQSPRYLTAYEGNVYVTLFDGHLASIDTAAMKITRQVKIGPNPYQVRAAGGKLYVANSGGYNPVQDSTLSVVDPVTFQEEKKIVVGLNPTTVCADSDGELYVMCMGNFADVKASVRRVDTKAGTSETIYTNDNMVCALQNDKLYVISSENDADWQPVNTKFILYDAKADREVKDNFITDGTSVKKSYSLSVDPYAGDIYIGTSDYTSTGDMYIFSAEGKLLNQLAVSGINPMGAYFPVQ